MNNSSYNHTRSKKILPLLLLSIFIQLAFSHTCHHDHLEHDLEFTDNIEEPEMGRMLEEQEYQNIRIYADFTYLQGIDPVLLNYIQNELLPAAINYYTQTLKVIPLTANLTSNKAQMCNITTPAVYTGVGVEADLGLIVDAVHESSDYIAYARACVLSRFDNRPIFGSIHFNLDFIKLGDENQHLQNILTTIHEMAHVLGISKGLFNYYYDRQKGSVITGHVKEKVINGVTTFLVDLEPLTTKLQNFYNCSEIDGVILENEGPAESAKSHLERRIFFNDMMTASSIENPKISEFMLAFLEGTGWYKGNYNMTESLYWGKGKGCSFYFGSCIDKTTHIPNFDEFCSGLTETGCDSSRRYGAACGGSSIKKVSIASLGTFDYWTDGTAVSDMFADNCPYFVANDNKDCQDPFQQNRSVLKGELYGAGSKCFTGNLFTTTQTTQKKSNYCLRASCQQQADSTFIMNIVIGGATAICTTAGPINVAGYNGQLDCPDPNSYCSTYGKDFCPRGCMGRGQCQNSVCQCEEGWGGIDCGTKILKQNCTKCAENPFMKACYGDKCGCAPNDESCQCPDGTRDCVIELAFTQAERNELAAIELSQEKDNAEMEFLGSIILKKSGLFILMTLICMLA